MQDQIHEARAIAHTLLQAFPEGSPKCWGDFAKAVVDNALRLAELSAELLPVLEGAVAEGVEATVRAHEQLNGMQANLERIGASDN